MSIKGDFMQKYMAYVGSYSYTGKAKGITVFDVNVERGTFSKRTEIEVDNVSDLIVSFDLKTLYSVEDYGVAAFRILDNGSLTRICTKKINGMRPHHLAIDETDSYLYVSGYHDGKLTILKLKEDGSVGAIIDEVYHKGLGSIAERASRPHITCSKPTRDGRFVMSADPGIDQVSIYRFTGKAGELRLLDAIRPRRGSSPYCFSVSRDNRFMYLMYDMTNTVEVYKYEVSEERGTPEFEKLQSVRTTGDRIPGSLNAGTCMRFTPDDRHLFVGNAGSNSVTMFERDEETGLLTSKFNLPISGAYPKDLAVFPDGNHIVSVNHENGALSFFRVDYEKNLIVMSSAEIPVSQPNCCVIVPVGGKK